MSLKRLKQEIVEELKNDVYSIIEEALAEEGLTFITPVFERDGQRIVAVLVGDFDDHVELHKNTYENAAHYLKKHFGRDFDMQSVSISDDEEDIVDIGLYNDDYVVHPDDRFERLDKNKIISIS